MTRCLLFDEGIAKPKNWRVTLAQRSFQLSQTDAVCGLSFATEGAVARNEKGAQEMSSDEKKGENIPCTEAYYESVASQEEVYLEETQEEVREILIFEAPSSLQSEDCTFESLDDLLADAAEELITGDADDPPLSREVIAEMRTTSATIRTLTLLQESF